ncbi:hypothetical protein ACQPZA_35965 [Pseudonocardia xinjiangensis]|uniref:hypothetical protein n=1 Tax=Pseudonocardia xinjiangensis TaxID=75289 RepID=UPI003D908587
MDTSNVRLPLLTGRSVCSGKGIHDQRAPSACWVEVSETRRGRGDEDRKVFGPTDCATESSEFTGMGNW